MNSGSAPRPALFSGILLLGALCLGALVRSYGPALLSACFLPIPIFEWTGLLALVAGLSGAVVLHEAGHLFAALANDFEVSAIVLGPFRFARLGTSWTLILKTQRLLEASVSAFPRTEENWRRRMLIVVAAGPLATLLTGCASVLLFHMCAGGNSWFLCPLRAFAQVSFFIFVLGLVPNHRLSPCLNDAALLRSLWLMNPQANEILLYHLVLQQQRIGIRPRHYPQMLIQRLTRFEGKPDFMAFFATTVASWAFDKGDVDTGNSWDQQALQSCSHDSFYSRSLVVVNSACFDLIYRNDLISARAKLSKLDLDKIVSPYLQRRARAAFHLTSRRITEALADIAGARFALPKRLRDSGVEYLLLSHLHAVTLTMRPAELSANVRQSAMTISRQISPAAI